MNYRYENRGWQRRNMSLNRSLGPWGKWKRRWDLLVLVGIDDFGRFSLSSGRFMALVAPWAIPLQIGVVATCGANHNKQPVFWTSSSLHFRGTLICSAGIYIRRGNINARLSCAVIMHAVAAPWLPRISSSATCEWREEVGWHAVLHDLSMQGTSANM
jgi:hypothetical protein